MSQLIKLSDKLQKEADEVINQCRLLSVLDTIGKVKFVGSYALNLMYRPDIDIFCLNTMCSKEVALSTTKQFLDSNMFQTVGFANCNDYQCNNGPTGYYWELIYEYNQRKWKFDIWYTTESNYPTLKKTAVLKSKLKENSEARGKILQLKDQYFIEGKYTNEMNGYKIYEEILGKI